MNYGCALEECLRYQLYRLLLYPHLPLYHFYKTSLIQFKMAIIFFIAGIAWIFIMPQHAIVHTFTIKHLAVFVVFVSGYGLIKYIELFRQSLLSIIRVYYVYLKFGFAYPQFGTNTNLW